MGEHEGIWTWSCWQQFWRNVQLCDAWNDMLQRSLEGFDSTIMNRACKESDWQALQHTMPVQIQAKSSPSAGVQRWRQLFKTA